MIITDFTNKIQKLEHLKDSILSRTNLPKTIQDARYIALDSLQFSIGNCGNLLSGLSALKKYNTKDYVLNEKNYLEDLHTNNTLEVTEKSLADFLNKSLVRDAFSIINNLIYNLFSHVRPKDDNIPTYLNSIDTLLTSTLYDAKTDDKTKCKNGLMALYFLNKAYDRNFIHKDDDFEYILSSKNSLKFNKNKNLAYNWIDLSLLLDKIIDILCIILLADEITNRDEQINDFFAL